MRIDTTIKSKSAPGWFQKGYKSLKGYEEKLSQVIGIDYNFIEKRRIKMMEKPMPGRKEIIEATLDTIKQKKKEDYTEEEQKEIDILTDIVKKSMDVLWLKFRLENLKNDFGEKDLRYDFINQTIVIDS